MSRIAAAILLTAGAANAPAENICVNKATQDLVIAQRCPAGYKSYKLPVATSTTLQSLYAAHAVPGLRGPQGDAGQAGRDGLGVARVFDANGIELGILTGQAMPTSDYVNIYNEALNVAFSIEADGYIGGADVFYTDLDCKGDALLEDTSRNNDPLIANKAKPVFTDSERHLRVLVGDQRIGIDAIKSFYRVGDRTCHSAHWLAQPAATFTAWLEQANPYSAETNASTLDRHPLEYCRRSYQDPLTGVATNYGYIDPVYHLCWSGPYAVGQAQQEYANAKKNYDDQMKRRYSSTASFTLLPLQDLARPLVIRH